MFDLVVGGRIFYRGRLVTGEIGISQGKIAKIGKTLSGDIKVDVGAGLVLPAAVDTHVHFRDPGFTHKEDFTTGTTSAAFGGVGCVCDMPNTRPFVDTPALMQEKIDEISKKALVDFGLYASVNPELPSSSFLPTCIGYKIFLNETTAASRFNSEMLGEVMLDLSNTDRICAIHAELELGKRSGRDSRSLDDHERMRPVEGEVRAIKTITNSLLPLQNKPRVHICHISSEEGLMQRQALQDVSTTMEATPHHLLLHSGMEELGTLGKVNPPIRSRRHRDALWQGLKDGQIDTIASDHAPHLLDEKDVDFHMAPSGLPGVETRFPLFLSKVKHNDLDLSKVIELCCMRPASLFGLPKGEIAEGFDADLAIVDPRDETKIKADDLHSKCGWSPFDRMSAIFPSSVIVRGQFIIEDHVLVGESGTGHLYP